MMIMMTKPYAYAEDADDDNDHKTDCYTAAGAAPGASVPCSLSRLPAPWDLGLRDLGLRDLGSCDL